MSDPASDAFEELDLRSSSDVARRCVVLYAVVAAGHNTSRGELVHWLRREGLWASASPEETAFLRSSSPPRQQMINATWRAEALFPLLWAIHKIWAWSPPSSPCELPLIQAVLPPLLASTSEFVSDVSLRGEAEILDAHEETYQAHWTVRDAVLNGRVVPNEFNPGIIEERHRALNWLISREQDWDDVTTDT